MNDYGIPKIAPISRRVKLLLELYERERDRRRRAANPEKERESARRWREANPESVIASNARQAGIDDNLIPAVVAAKLVVRKAKQIEAEQC